MWVDLVKAIGLSIISPVLVAYMTIKIAKFHFEKEIKTKYLLAKDKTATDVLNSLCLMLTSMWEMVNINFWIQQGTASQDDPNIIRQRQAARDNFHNAIKNSYMQLGAMGLYYGTGIIDIIAQLQSELNDMVNNNDFSAFENWDEFRRNRLLPVLQRVHEELRNTVFERTKSFHLIFE